VTLLKFNEKYDMIINYFPTFSAKEISFLIRTFEIMIHIWTVMPR